MPLFPIPIEEFGGLNLATDSSELGFSGAVDMANVDLDGPGRVRSRDGFAKLTTAPAVAAYHTVAPYYKTDGTKQLIAAFGGGSGAINALNTSGGIVAAQAAANTTYGSVARFAAPGSEHAYVAVAGTGAATVYRWDGAAWSTPVWTGTTPTGRHLAVYPQDSGGRLANARYAGSSAGNNPSTVRFSYISPGPPAAATPTTWQANDYVDLSPGDGEEIAGIIPWQSNLFAFKETKFFVFYGTSEDGSGNPVFENRPIYGQGLVSSGGNSAYRALAASPLGVFFLNRRGVWLTTGGAARRVSEAIDPIFRGTGLPGAYSGSALNQGSINTVAMTWHDNRLYVAYPSGASTTNDSILVYDPQANYWLLWTIPVSSLCTFRPGNVDELCFSFSGGLVTLSAPTGVSTQILNVDASNIGTSPIYYKVTATNASGETTPSAEVTATPTVLQPNVAIHWPAVAGATGYRVYHGTAPGAENQFFAVASNTFTDIASRVWTNGTPPVSNTATTVGFDVGRYNVTSGYTQDGGDGLTTGAAIPAYYQSGFDNLAPPRRFAAHYLFGNTRKRFRKWKVTGTGNVTLGIAHEMGSVGTIQALTLGVAPAIKDGWFNRAVRGQLVSYRLSSTTPFSVNKLTAYLAGSEPPLLGDPSDT